MINWIVAPNWYRWFTFIMIIFIIYDNFINWYRFIFSDLCFIDYWFITDLFCAYKLDLLIDVINYWFICSIYFPPYLGHLFIFLVIYLLIYYRFSFLLVSIIDLLPIYFPISLDYPIVTIRSSIFLFILVIYLLIYYRFTFLLLI